MSNKLSPEQFARYVDHTILKPEATEDQVLQTLQEAKQYGFLTVCLERQWVAMGAKELAGTSSIPITVVGFPGGAETTELKREQSVQAVNDGARELDMVLNRAWLKEGNYNQVLSDIRAVVEVSKEIPVKVILETSELTNDEKKKACELCQEAGAAFVKTSTGFSSGGATVADIQLMRETVGPDMGVKASGGIRTLESAMAMIEAGASRLGMSASVNIYKELAR